MNRVFTTLSLIGLFLMASTGISVAASIGTNSAVNTSSSNLQVATFAGGCFWCVEAGFEKLDGVSEVVSGFTGGKIKSPTYKQVASGSTKHIEAVQVFYDAQIISYEQLLPSFWRQINPTDSGGQFVDRGHQYSPVIFFHNKAQKTAAEKSRKALTASNRFKQPLATPIRVFEIFYNADDYHQDYYKRNPIRYKYYRFNSGRDQFLEKIWGSDLHASLNNKPTKSASNKKYNKPSDAQLRKQLSPLQYLVTQEEGTERPFKNTYWNEKRDGIYVDIVSSEPLFSSLDKYDSKTGWPSFTRPLKAEHIIEKRDFKLIYPRTELRSRGADSHLGHIFKDGPQPTGLRYCINSAAMRFIPKADLEKEGHGEFIALFAKQ